MWKSSATADSAAEALSPAIAQLAREWAASPLRPRPTQAVLDGWDRLLDGWAASDLPLIVRSARLARGAAHVHCSSRAYTVSDNTAAHWTFSEALDGRVPVLEQIRAQFAAGAMPLAFAVKTSEKADGVYIKKRVLPRINAAGWKVCHIKRVSSGSKVDWTNCDVEEMKLRFRTFLSPRNMFVVPLTLGGLGELSEMISAIIEADATSQTGCRQAEYRP